MRMEPDEYREARIAAGLTQAELAELLGVTKHCIQDRENGRNRITREAELALKTITASRKASGPRSK